MAASGPSHLATVGDENPVVAEVNKPPYTQFAYSANGNAPAKLFSTYTSLTVLLSSLPLQQTQSVMMNKDCQLDRL